MKHFIKTHMYRGAFKFVQIICAAAFLMPASASGKPGVHFVSPDIWAYPIVAVGGERIRYRDADAIYTTRETPWNLMSETERGCPRRLESEALRYRGTGTSARGNVVARSRRTIRFQESTQWDLLPTVFPLSFQKKL